MNKREMENESERKRETENQRETKVEREMDRDRVRYKKGGHTFRASLGYLQQVGEGVGPPVVLGWVCSRSEMKRVYLGCFHLFYHIHSSYNSQTLFRNRSLGSCRREGSSRHDAKG